MRMLSPLGIGWLDVETLNEPSGKPYLVLHGRAESLASQMGLAHWSVSLSHDGGMAIALVVALSRDRPDDGCCCQKEPLCEP